MDIAQTHIRDLIKLAAEAKQPDAAMKYAQAACNAANALSALENIRLDTRRHARLTSPQIMHMLNRFLAWELPKDFSPDAGISYMARELPPGHPGPSGTNLLNAAQAEAMIRHMLEGMP